jgi:Flp pilus assembly protein TadG
MKDESGAALVEFAIIAPALTLLIIGGLDLGLELLNQERLLFCDTASRRR